MERNAAVLTRSYGRSEEIAHAASHGLGMVLALTGMVVLVRQTAVHGDAWHLTTGVVFGATLVLLYLASTLYHALPASAATPLLRTLDHAAIYLLIAGTYTPVTLVSLRGVWGWSLFALVWGGAVVGIALEANRHGRRSERSRRDHILSITLYVAMGWCIVLAFRPLAERVGAGGVRLFVLGGLAYTFGIGFYAWKGLRFHHLIWHLFVLTGSILHYLAVLLYVMPRRT